METLVWIMWSILAAYTVGGAVLEHFGILDKWSHGQEPAAPSETEHNCWDPRQR